MKDTKEFILKTAYYMFLRNNYEAVTMSKISSATNLTKGVIYHHFTSKEELFKAVVDKYILENKVKRPNRHENLREFIEQSIQQMQDKVSEDSTQVKDLKRTEFIHYLSFIVDTIQYYPGFKNIGQKFYKEGLKFWKILLEDAMRKGEIRNDIDTEAIAMNFLSINFGIGSNMILTNSVEYAFDMYKRQMEEQYKLLLI